jgi:hypothetical protein
MKPLPGNLPKRISAVFLNVKITTLGRNRLSLASSSSRPCAYSSGRTSLVWRRAFHDVGKPDARSERRVVLVAVGSPWNHTGITEAGEEPLPGAALVIVACDDAHGRGVDPNAHCAEVLGEQVLENLLVFVGWLALLALLQMAVARNARRMTGTCRATPALAGQRRERAADAKRAVGRPPVEAAPTLTILAPPDDYDRSRSRRLSSSWTTVEGEDAKRLEEIATERGQGVDEVVADLVRQA